MIPASRAAQTYYRELPDSLHRTGDIWSGLPTFELFPGRKTGSVSGLVITPACDLSNCKTPTITYLPILSIRELLATEWGYSIVRPPMVDILNAHQRNDLADLLGRGAMPASTSIDLLQDAVQSEISGLSHEKKARLESGITALKHLASDNNEAGSFIRSTIRKQDWQRICSGLVRNSYSDDIHFLPPEAPLYEFSAIREPSVVAFRYPMTIPRIVLDAATTPNASWGEVCSRLAPLYGNQMERQPMKVTRLEREFLADLLTRFARLYIRLGSADFSNDAVQNLSTQIDEVC